MGQRDSSRASRPIALFPFWVDDKRVAFATKGKDKRLVAHDARGITKDVTKRFAHMELK